MYSNYNYGQPGQPSAPGYSPYSAPGTNFDMNPEIKQFFDSVDQDHSGRINGVELQAALINGQGNNFSDSVCSLMVNVFGKEQKGTISPREFQYLYEYINNWINTFQTYDRDNSGFIEESELSSALQQMGYRFGPQFYKSTLFNAPDRSKITVDQFIEFCMKIQKFTELFRERDVEQKGVITIGYEDFINLCLTNCS